MMFQMRLCQKRMRDVEIEAETREEAVEIGHQMLEKGLRVKNVTHVEFIEIGTGIETKFGELPLYEKGRKTDMGGKLDILAKKRKGG